MKTILSLSALLITLTLTAQTNTATWYLNDTSGNGIQSPFGNTASGGFSTAMGISTLASGTFSTAMGDTTTASGLNSTAMGRLTEASGDYSTTFGVISKAQGNTSAAMGYGTIASDYGSLVIGVNNLIGSTITSDANNLDLDNTAFVIGNGADAGNRSDALTVLFDGTTTIAGSVTATSFIGDGSQLTNLSSSSPFSLNTTSGNGIQSNDNTASGDTSTAMGGSTTASGDYSTAMGRNTEASGWASAAMGYQTEASSDYSTSMGNRTLASGTVSTAMGRNTTASGYASTAMGYQTEASSDYSTSMGDSTTASGVISTAIGYLSTASGTVSTAMGWLTEASGDYSTSMGNRTLASGDTSTAMGYYTTASGDYSTSMGDSTTASGVISTAMGYGTIASDYGSLVIGVNNLIGSTITSDANNLDLDNTAFVIGNGADAGNRSDALTVLFDGTTTIAGSVTATSFIGDGSQLTNLSSSSPFSLNTTSGNGIQSNDNTASGDTSTAMGYYTTASGGASTAMGAETKASGVLSTAMGLSTIASDTSSLVIGEYNLLGSTVTNSATDFSTDNTAFVIGNGADADNRSDALTVLFDGTTTIAGDLSINSDARLKANIISLGSTLAKLLQIDGKTYTMKKDENKKQKIGVLAQDIEKVFPELVSESNGVKSVNYQGLVPVLINALKEQDSKMNEQEAKLNKQQAEIDELKAIVTKLITP